MKNLFDGRLRWLLIFWMFLMSAIAYLDRVNVSIAGQAIQKDFNLSNVQLGYVFSAFVIGYALFQAPGGYLADKYGPRAVIAAGVVWWGIFTTATAWVPTTLVWSITILIVMRFLLGLGEAVVFPSSNRLVAAWIPSQERGLANGLIFAGVGAGAGITPPLITYVLMNYGWRWSFYVCAIIGLIAGAIWLMLARDTPRTHPWASQREIDLIESGLPAPAKDFEKHKALPWSAIAGDRNIIFLSISYFTYGYAAYIFFTWFFIYLSKVRGLDLKSSALYSMLPFIAMATASSVGGFVADRLTRKYGKRVGRCGLAIFGLAMAGVFIVLATQVESARLASVVLAGGAGALYLSQSAFWTVTADVAGSSAGSASGLMNMFNQIGGAITASLSPLLAAEFGWSASFIAAGVLCMIGALAWIPINPDRPISRGNSAV